jgi:hypothetical protein
VVAGSFDDDMPVLLTSSFECSSSDLAEDFPPSGFKKVVAITKFERLLLQIDEEFGWIAIEESVNHVFHIIALAVLERSFDHVLSSIGTLDLESGLRLTRHRLETLSPPVASTLGSIAALLRSIVSRHCCCCSGGVSILHQEILVILIKMSFPLWT